MSFRIPEHASLAMPKVAKRWPHRLLNFLPSRQLWRYLTWQSGGLGPEMPFDIGKELSGADRVLMLLPDSLPELLIALPTVQAHFQALPKAAIWLMAGPRETPFLSSIFGRERMLVLEPEQFFLGEGHFQDLLGRLQGMRADAVINFRTGCPPLVHYLLRGTRAAVRIQLGSEPQWPFSNVTLVPVLPRNPLRHFQMEARLWDAAGIPVAGKWARLEPPADSLARAEALLKPAGLKAGNTWLFPWQDAPADAQASLLRELAAATGAAGHSLAVLQAEGGLFSSPSPPPEIAVAHPLLKTDSPGTLLALFASTAGTVGMQGNLVLLAGLTDADVTAYFREEDAPYDTSELNRKLRVIPLNQRKES